MNRGPVALATMLAAAMLARGDAQAQARGPSAQEVQENGQHIVEGLERGRQIRQQMQEERQQERIEQLDPATRARKLAELDAVLRRLPGWFRIEGKIESTEVVQPEGTANIPLPDFAITPPGSVMPSGGPMVRVKHTGDIAGTAHCSAIGEGVGLNCVITASWQPLDLDSGQLPAYSYVLSKGQSRPSEVLNTMQPAMLVLGLNMDPPEIRAMMVTADTVAQNWVGKLDDSGAISSQVTGGCKHDPGKPGYFPCYGTFKVIAEPDSDVVSFVFDAGIITVNLTMHRDPRAELEDPLQPLMIR